MKALESEKELEKSSNIRTLIPYLDEHGVLRSRGRLENISAVPKSARTPILLPHKGRIVRMIVRSYHEKYLHQADNVAEERIRFHRLL
uniref:Uncharacterized protein n=1 Tax=Anopheles epiroticus TaxID=199890 RepID=A0A182P391_9DIPT